MPRNCLRADCTYDFSLEWCRPICFCFFLHFELISQRFMVVTESCMSRWVWEKFLLQLFRSTILVYGDAMYVLDRLLGKVFPSFCGSMVGILCAGNTSNEYIKLGIRVIERQTDNKHSTSRSSLNSRRFRFAGAGPGRPASFNLDSTISRRQQNCLSTWSWFLDCTCCGRKARWVADLATEEA